VDFPLFIFPSPLQRIGRAQVGGGEVGEVQLVVPSLDYLCGERGGGSPSHVHGLDHLCGEGGGPSHELAGARRVAFSARIWVRAHRNASELVWIFEDVEEAVDWYLDRFPSEVQLNSQRYI